MILIEDTRQQRLKHNIKRDFFRSKGIILRKEALDCGDYTLIYDRSVVVDTKKDIQELIGDIQVKTISLKELAPAVHEIYKKYNLTGFEEEKMVRLIFDSDVGRNPEREILVACNKNSLLHSDRSVGHVLIDTGVELSNVTATHIWNRMNSVRRNGKRNSKWDALEIVR